VFAIPFNNLDHAKIHHKKFGIGIQSIQQYFNIQSRENNFQSNIMGKFKNSSIKLGADCTQQCE